MENLKNQLNWFDLYSKNRLKAHNDRDLSPTEVSHEVAESKYMEKLMNMKDTFIPGGINQFTPDDLAKLWALRETFLAMSSSGIGIYQLYRTTVEKVLVLAYENFPDEVDGLSKRQLEQLLGMKMAQPTEKSLYSSAYAFLLDHQPNPYQSTGLDFGESVKVITSSANFPKSVIAEGYREVKKDQFADKLEAVDSEYRRYFTKLRRAS